MANPTPAAQITAREIPITVQGSKIVEGTDRRELFTETLKTTLVFDNGAAINMKARVAPGQSLFLRNELSGREILCRIVEAPLPGQTGCTDLEFTVHDPDFWNTPGVADESHAAADDKTAPQESAPAPTETSGSSHIQSADQSGAPIHPPAIPVAAHTAPPAPVFSAKPEQLEPLSEPAPVPEADESIDAEKLAGILAKYAKAAAKRSSAKSAENLAQQQSAADAVSRGDAAPGVTPRPAAFSTFAFRLHAIRELTVRKNPIVLGIVACIVIGSALGVAWDVTRMLYPQSSQSLAAIARAKVPTPHAKGAPSKTAVAKAGNAEAGKPVGGKIEAAPPRPAAKIQPSVAAQVPAAEIAKSPAATTGRVIALQPNKEAQNSAAPVVFRVEPGPGALNSDQAPDGTASPAKTEPETVPARILSQYQPPLPPWAKHLDLGGVVKLDAVIDEKGNLQQVKLLSGPRVLESSAEGAVGLWIFQPALKNGKPTAAHMTLTVEFQR